MPDKNDGVQSVLGSPSEQKPVMSLDTQEERNPDSYTRKEFHAYMRKVRRKLMAYLEKK